MDATTTAFIQYGALGAITLVSLLAVRHLFQQVKAHADRETERADRNEAKLLETNKVMMEQVIPAVLDMVATTKQVTQLIAELQADRRRRE